MADKHSLLPWAVAGKGDRNNRTVILDGNGDPFVYVAGETVADQLRDARLLSAAPELLAALRGLMDRPGPLFHLIDDERHWPQIAAARAAIAKATGEQA